MGFQDDWVLRQIEIIARYVANLIFHKNRITYTFETTDMLSEMDQLHLVLDRLVQENRVGEAEDLLFENIRMTDKYIELATDFYSRLNGMTDAELKTLSDRPSLSISFLAFCREEALISTAHILSAMPRFRRASVR